MINENASIYIGIVTACILETAPTATVIVRKLVMSAPIDDGYEVIGTAKDKQGASVQASHLFATAHVRTVSARDLQQAARLAGDSVGHQLRNLV